MSTRSRARGKHHAPAVSIPEPAPALEAAMVETTVETTAEILYDRGAIARLAYSYWEARGRQGGSEAEDWLRAEKEFQKRWRLAGNL